MAHKDHGPSKEDLSSLVGGIVEDARKLIEQQIDLLRHEVKHEIDKAKSAALSMGVGAGLTATGGILSTLMVVRLLHSSTGLPLWSCYGIVGGLLGVAGLKLMSSGAAKAADIHLIPSQSVEALKENVAALT